MRAIIQRVTQAQVNIDNKLFSEIGNGLLVLLGIEFLMFVLFKLVYKFVI